ncbi:MAG: hypothetical protein KDC34_03065 [Saprospiraceae bacterium]|nr:hypothetical protein [Saprospiraceae bacterium]
MLRAITILALLFSLNACQSEAPIPVCIENLIAEWESNPVTNPPSSVFQYEYNGMMVYYLPPMNGDIYSNLYNENCEIICHPDGGLTGTGDGQCPDFAKMRKNERLVWKDMREAN